ncbi:MAG: hypothetical protein R2736_01705 [Solirubrobacterales bacterium]
MVVGGRPAGQVTAPALAEARHDDRMAWVPVALATDGASITISDEAKTIAATITTKPFYDPEGEVLRS